MPWDLLRLGGAFGSTGGTFVGRPVPALLATALLAVTVVGLGLRLKRRLLVLMGVVMVLASLATLRFYFQLFPLWIVLTLAGLAAIGVTLALRRWLDRGPGRERAGFTAEALFDDERRQGLLEAAVAATQLSRAAPAREPGVRTGGGQSGGAGATGSF